MKLLVTNNTAVNIVFENLGGYVLEGNAEEVDFLLIGKGYALEDVYKGGYLRKLYDSGDVQIFFEDEYRLESYCSIGDYRKDALSYNYIYELLNGYWFTQIQTFVMEGSDTGCLIDTKYYRNYVDDNNVGELILTVAESYTMEEDDRLFNSQKKALIREKYWTLVKNDGTEDTVKIKTKTKEYNSRLKSHREGNKRRINIQEQLIDNVVLAGLLSGIFTSEDDAFNKLVELQDTHNDSFSVWLNSGRGSIYDDITNDTNHTWLDSVICNQTNQPPTPRAEIGPIELITPWMMNMSMKSYIVEKLKANIK
jgi:hypothetical protein